MHYIRETTNIWALSLIFIYKMKGKDPEIGSEGKKKEKEKGEETHNIKNPCKDTHIH